MQARSQLETTTPSSQAAESPPLQMVMTQMITGYWVSQSIHAAAKLGIADQLAGGEKSCQELAIATETNEQALYRLLRALAGVGIFAETPAGKFAMTPLSDFLRSDTVSSLRDMSIMMGDREYYRSWGNVLHAIKTGSSGFEQLFGMNLFEYYKRNPEPADVFDRAMTSLSSVDNAAVCSDYDFSSVRTLVDVAGGHGSLLTSILRANPSMSGILFDLPGVIERAEAHVAASGVSDRCDLVSGSFFESVPSGADAYILKHIIHDWDDERAAAILKQCHRAMASNGRVLVVEQVIPPGNDPFAGKLLDVNMLVMCPGGKERTAEEFRVLFAESRFNMTRIVPTEGAVSVVEGTRI